MEKLARLSMLDIEDVESFKNDIDEIMRLAQVLNSIEPDNLITDGHCELREDDIIPSFKREEMLANAKAVKDGFIIVPKVVG